jgi:2-isopropylmalate synthase
VSAPLPASVWTLRVRNSRRRNGNGPVDAAIKALKNIINRTDDLKGVHHSGHQQRVRRRGQGAHAGGIRRQIYYGFGANTDIVTASVEAYIDCINKFRVK